MTAPEDDSFSAKLRRLINTVHPPDREPYTYREIAQGVADLGVTLSATTISDLVNGKRTEPKMVDVQGLASFFGVPVDYFLDPTVTARVDAQIADLTAARAQQKLTENPRALELALRTVNLDAAGQDAVDNLIKALETHQQRDPATRPRRRRDHTGGQ